MPDDLLNIRACRMGARLGSEGALKAHTHRVSLQTMIGRASGVASSGAFAALPPFCFSLFFFPLRLFLANLYYFYRLLLCAPQELVFRPLAFPVLRRFSCALSLSTLPAFFVLPFP